MISNKNIVGFTMIDSGGRQGSGKSGPRRTAVTIGGNGYWDYMKRSAPMPQRYPGIGLPPQ